MILSYKKITSSALRKIERILFYHQYKMYISRRGFWFVDIPRTSGSSIMQEINKYYPFKNESKFRIQQHMPAIKARKFLGISKWDNKILTFSLVRNPWSRCLSLYNWFINHGYYTDLNFTDYVFEIEKYYQGEQSRVSESYITHFGSWDYITDEKGNVIVDLIGKFEDRESFLKKIGNIIKIPEFGSQFNDYKHQVNMYGKYSHEYNNKTKDIIARIYSREIQFFGYQFGD